MARQATIRIDVEASEARASIQNLSEEFRSMEASTERAEAGVRSMGSATEQSSQDMREMGAAVTQFSDQARRMETATERAAQGVREYGQAAQRASQETVTMRSSLAASANNLGFEFVQAAQDAKFGAAGVANQLPLMAEQLSQVTAKAGGTTAALRTLGSSLLGPVGVIGAVTLLITYQEDIVSFFSSSSESAEDAGESFRGFFREAEKGLQNLDQLQSELKNVGGSVGLLDTLLTDAQRSAAFYRDILIGEAEQSVFGALGAVGGELTDAAGRVSGFNRALESLSNRWQASQLTARTERLRAVLKETGPAARVAEDRLRSLGINVEQITEGTFQQARAEVKRFREELAALSFEGLLEEDPSTAAAQARREFQQVSREALRMSGLPGVTERDVIERRVEFLESTLEQAAAALTPEEFQQNFAGLSQRLSTLQAELENMGGSAEESADDTTSALEEQQNTIGNLRDTLKTLRSPEGNRLARLKDQRQELKQQVELARFLNRLEEGLVLPEVVREQRATGVQPAGTVSPRRQVLADPTRDLRAAINESIRQAELAGLPRQRDQAFGALRAGRQAGIFPQFQSLQQVLGGQGPGEPQGLQAMSMSLDEIQNKFDVSEQKARQFKQAAQSQFGQVANAATAMGSALVSALGQGEKKAQDIAAILLQGVGGVLSAIPGVGTAAGPVLSRLGGLVGSFEHGGTMPRAGAAEVHPPEFVMAGGGTQIVGREETEEIIRAATSGRGGRDDALLREVRRLAEQPSVVKIDPYAVQSELSEIQSEKDTFSA